MEISIGVTNKMNFIDSHCHISCDDNFNENLLNLKNNMSKNKIDKAVLFIDPFVKEFTCFNEKKEDFHYCHVTDRFNDIDKLSIICDKCNRVIYEGNDPFNKYNKNCLIQ